MIVAIVHAGKPCYDYLVRNLRIYAKLACEVGEKGRGTEPVYISRQRLGHRTGRKRPDRHGSI